MSREHSINSYVQKYRYYFTHFTNHCAVMPITPRFKLSQTETNVTIIIHIPHIRVSASTLDIVIDGYDFHFHSSPYLLHLSFPGRLVDDMEKNQEAKATYDPSNQNGVLTIIIFKEERGLWKDLDLLGNLVNRSSLVSSETGRMPKIQVVSSTENNANDSEKESVQEEDNFFTSSGIHSCLKPHYGFLNMHHSVFTDYAREGLSHDMLEIPSPDETPADQRRDLRSSTERLKFDADRYLGDLDLSNDPEDECADMIFIEAIRMEPHWDMMIPTYIHDLTNDFQKLDTKETTIGHETSDDFFSEEEKLQLFQNKSMVPPVSRITPDQMEALFLSLLDIIYAYAYDHRTTLGDATCESSWTIVMISPTLSWLECYTPPYDDIPSVVRWCIRRALIYPYLRNFDFVANKLVKDAEKIFAGGKRVILRCLLQIQNILEKSEFHYLFNKLYICPYITWIQSIREEDILNFATRLRCCIASEKLQAKEALDLNLEMHESRVLGDIMQGSDVNSEEDSSTHSSEVNVESDNETSSKSTDSDSSDEDSTESSRALALLDSRVGHDNFLEISHSQEVAYVNVKTDEQNKVLIREL